MIGVALSNLTFFSTRKENANKIDAARIESRNAGSVNFKLSAICRIGKS
jgi:hypothetical protein